MNKLGRTLLVVLVLAVCGMLLYPTVKWYCFVPQDVKNLAAGSNENIRDWARGQASREIATLRGMLQSDRNQAVPEDLGYLIGYAEDARKDNGIDKPESWDIYALLSSFRSEDELFSVIESYYRDRIMEAKRLSGNVLQLGLDLRGGMSVVLEADTAGFEAQHGYVPSGNELAGLIAEDIEILTSRIDQFGVTEPDIRQQGADQILIEVPGEVDPERVDSFLMSRGSLTFHLVDQELTNRVNRAYMGNRAAAFRPDGSIIVPDYIPEDRELLGYYTEDEYGIDELREFVVIYSDVALDGTHLESARMERNPQNNQPVVNFRLDSEGGDIFYNLTSRHVGEELSVVMDGKVKSVAVINSAISQDVQLSGSFTEEEARSLAVALRTSSLPIDLTVVSQQGVGASLGSDAVTVALRAILFGLLLIVLFMVIYYGPAGFIADFALIMNFYMMIAVLSALHFTLTLASVAGLVLTLGMAIDANVIIYERMKEELAGGKSPYDTVKLGFGRAFWTIMDSNVTTIIAAVVLSVLGSSTVKGFANTLAVGIFCSLFTSLFVSHLLFDFFVKEESFKGVRLSWRRRI